ncbi:MAG TPA: hypothetical protein VHB27_10495 [Rhodopila sp.]|uniref:metallophosphoesterase family protein n=1 Tax=Rhodopila sp. TaxID=2480087 RepID=UPI002C640CCC|nr:hypothetical protein [Rhodopila sp.]HVY15651.1 hypothetical protein [Rhodopila sp.]
MHERTFAAVNAVVRRLAPPPQFILFPGDEIAGLTPDPAALRAQWRHWFDHEMAWLDRAAIPLWHTTGNHTAYDPASEAVFRDVLHHLPRNGPPDQEGLSYWVRRDDLLLVFVHTLWTGLGGEGHVETAWLRQVLHDHADARYKLVLGHHPVHPVNGFAGPYQRDIGPEHAAAFWDLLVDNGVLAYLCSHILAFDVQVHRGVLQVCSAGAGTAHRMPEGVEYLHCVQAALDADGLRYQVLDTEGRVRERLAWPFVPPSPAHRLSAGEHPAPFTGDAAADRIVGLRFTGRAAPAGTSAIQTLLSVFDPNVQAPLQVGLRGPDQRVVVVIGADTAPGRSPHSWIGPPVAPAESFDIRLVFHAGMGPGGILCRFGEAQPWSSLAAASPWGPERLAWPSRWTVGHAQLGSGDRAFQGTDLVLGVGLSVDTDGDTGSAAGRTGRESAG